MRERKTATAQPLRYFTDAPTRTYELLNHLSFRRMLLLEDEAPVAELLRVSLERHGFQITHVPNGVQGVKLILDNDYDVILCDMSMPGFPGDMFYRAVQRIRPQLCHRFVFMTGHTSNRQIAEFVRSVRGLLVWKPFELQHLLDVLNLVSKKADRMERKPMFENMGMAQFATAS